MSTRTPTNYHNAGQGNRAVAQNIKALHDASGHSGNSISSQVLPSRSIAHAPGASSNVLKTPRRSLNKSSALMS